MKGNLAYLCDFVNSSAVRKAYIDFVIERLRVSGDLISIDNTSTHQLDDPFSCSFLKPAGLEGLDG